MKQGKKILIAISVALGIFLVMPLTDIILAKFFGLEPQFEIKEKAIDDGGTIEYIGIGYKIVKCNTYAGDKSVHIGLFNLKYPCSNISKDPNFFSITYLPTSCTGKMEKIYSDSLNDYYYACMELVRIDFQNGKRISLKEALEENIISIDKLIERGLNVQKKPVNE